MLFSYDRTVRFADTDAAGVVYFAKVLQMCHEAYEESLAAADIKLQTFFQDTSTAIPIIHAEVDFFRPMYWGDKLLIQLTPQLLNEKTFALNYQIIKDSSQYACAQTKHICIEPLSRKTKPLPQPILKWISG
jgi:1,4-dihydroxy-2-naphthoyl-CoA hydrolase